MSVSNANPTEEKADASGLVPATSTKKNEAKGNIVMKEYRYYYYIHKDLDDGNEFFKGGVESL